MKKILIFLCSQNNNKQLAESIASEITEQGNAAEVMDLVALDFPLYSSAAQDQVGAPKHLSELFDACQSSDGFIFVAPEYNGGIPPVLTNALAWLSIKGKNWRDAFNQKVAGIGTFSGGEGMQLIIALRSQLAYVGLTVIGRTLQVNYKKPLNPNSLNDFVQQLLAKA